MLPCTHEQGSLVFINSSFTLLGLLEINTVILVQTNLNNFESSADFVPDY